MTLLLRETLTIEELRERFEARRAKYFALLDRLPIYRTNEQATELFDAEEESRLAKFQYDMAKLNENF